MSVFGAYARYYDLLYRDKDYAAEAEFVHALIRKHHPRARTLLDLGCGTGRHAFVLAERGYEVTGVDRSEEMLAVARSQLSPFNPQPSTLNFFNGDIRSIRLGRTMDAVVSLFHVISYQTENSDLLASFCTVRDHLGPGGVFLFDCWYGPAVLSERPTVRVKRLEDELTAVTRIGEPVMHANGNVVDVNFQIFVQDKASGAVECLEEQHRMRYLFRPEIDLLLRDAGLILVDELEWMTGRPLGFGTWGACFVVKSA